MSVRFGLLVAAVAGCAGGDPEGDSAAPPVDLEPAVEVGTGEIAWEPLVDGGEVVIVFGPQGGYHLSGSLRVQGIEAGNPDLLSDPANPLSTFVVTRPNGDAISGLENDEAIRYRQGIDPTDEAGVYEMIGRRIFLDIASDEEIEGETLEVEVTVEDVNGVTVHDRRSVVAVPHPLNG